MAQQDYLELGPSPSGEDCVQVETGKDYMPAMRAELARYREFLEARFPEPPAGARFGIKWEHGHDFGTYGEVAVYFYSEDPKSSEFAFFVEANLPEAWEDKQVFGPARRKALSEEGAQAAAEKALQESDALRGLYNTTDAGPGDHPDS